MQIAADTHAIQHNFTIPLAPGKELPRFVWTYFLDGPQATLIDAGTAGYAETFLEYAKGAGIAVNAVRNLLFTHSHPDHVGGAEALLKHCSPTTFAHALEIALIEDPDLHFQTRPIPGFDLLVEGPVIVDRKLSDGDSISTGTYEIRAMSTPGHCEGHLSFFCPETGLLIAGDALPLPGEMPIYSDVNALLASAAKLASIRDVKILASSWDSEIFEGEEVADRIQATIEWVKETQAAVDKARQKAPGAEAMDLAPDVAHFLGLPPFVVNPLFAMTIRAHLVR